ncbi:uncharacterized protein MYCGRDRAFT_95555 [Zymoseptoria tritici IPO323]|uniref:F-box domain-containing protein n=1 Tax=Zymoseptoria tritici (strain CBS 115943 / IPO323) TaxID=336722 RepID=F9XJ24_ZYMTI|nr:uncharacterized protein MYCGRDRAFT_95555 [Zymoseptoria tritici IPO323]EGP84793.1 hypothetical protein MYCGRDRAFT_95555 [Zymoseptoria tritici IPO323]
MFFAKALRYLRGREPPKSSSKSLDDLPNELLDWICGYCDKPGIKALRLACRTTSHVATAYLFPEVVMLMNRDSLEACHGVAAHPIFSKTARNLWIQADRPRKTTLEEWNLELKEITELDLITVASDRIDQELVVGSREHTAAMDAVFREARNQFHIEKSPLSKEQRQCYHAHAVRLATDAQQMMRDQSLFACLREVLTKCDQIDSVDLTTCHHLRKATTAHNKSFAQGLLRPFGDLNEQESGVDAMTQLMLAASSVGFKPKKINLGNLSHLILINKEDFSEQLQELFTNVEHLVWEFSVPVYDDAFTLDRDAYEDIAPDLRETKALVSLMEVTTKLQHLRLELPDHPDADIYVTLQDIVGGTTWRHLTHLDIANFEAKPDDLTDLLIRHRDTLAHVKLGTVCLQTGTWPECFETFAGKLPKIEQFEVRGRFSDDSIDESFLWFGWPDEKHNNARGEEIRKFIINGGEECPAIHYQHDEDESTSEHPSEGNDEDGNVDLGDDEDDDDAEHEDIYGLDEDDQGHGPIYQTPNGPWPWIG